MLPRPPLREIKYAQILIVIQVLLGILGLTISLFRASPTRLFPFIDIIAYLLSIGVFLFTLFLGWQLGRLRSWARVILIALTGFYLLGWTSFLFDRSFLGAPMESPLYRTYLYSNVLLDFIVNVLLLYFLLRPVVRDTFRQAKQ